MIFNKTGHLFDKFSFKIGGTSLKVTDSYTYLGITFKPSGSFRQAMFDLGDKARRAYYKFRRHDTSNNVKLTFKFFDVLVKPILMYCAEVWTILLCPRLSNENLIKSADAQLYEKLNLNLCKYLLGVRRNTSNIASRGELGRYPLILDFLLQSYCFKSRISSSNIGLASDAYAESLTLGPSSWANLLGSMHERLSCFDSGRYYKHDMFLQLYDRRWLDKMNKNDTVVNPDTSRKDGNKLDTLKTVKCKFEMEPYVTMLPFEARRDFAKLRTSSHALEIEVGRYKDTPREERICKLCNLNCVENEAHFLISCPYYKDERKILFNRFSNLIPFELNDSPECFKKLFSCHDGFPPTIKLVCSLARSLTELRRLYFDYSKPVATITVTRSGRISKPPDLLTYDRNFAFVH